MMNYDLTPPALLPTLELAVVLRIAELEALRPAVRQRVIGAWAANAVDPIASRGDQLMFVSKARKRKGKSDAEGGTADTFNYLARALAALAYSPGGVTFLGQHWQATNDDVTPARPARRRRAKPIDVVELP